MRESPQRLDISQGSDKAIIDWRSFSIDADELVRFWQPSSSSIALNRVKGGEYSAILGQLIANGQVILINPNGILFGENARIDVGGLVATTINIDDEEFLEGRLNFRESSNPGGTVVNRGMITAAEGGLVALVAPGVENSGIIHARLGRVALASGNSFTLDLHGDNLVQLAIDDSVAERLFAPDGSRLKALVGNSGSIVADGGIVTLTAASAAKDVVDNVINVDGIVEARSAVKRNGQIVLQGTGEGVVRVSGKLDASGRGAGETGGKIKVLGEKVGIVGNARIDVSGDVGGGEILVGGNFQGNGPERNADYTTIGGGAVMRADALTGGGGGRVIIWSDRVTRFFGSISARGGRTFGDGGFVEVSGKRHLRFSPTAIDLGAPEGSIGELLLDPRDITISDSGGADDGKISNTDTSINFGDDSGTDYSIKPSAFEAINADITLQASRDITVSSPIDRSGSSASTLTLQAGRHLTISANITGTNGAHSFIFEADSPQSGTDNDGTGKLTIGDNVTITSNGGSITLIGADFAISTTSGSAASINAGTGDIHIAPSQATAALTIGSSGILSNAELGRLTTSGTIVLGTATTGPTGSGGAGSSISAASISVTEALSIGGSASLKFDSAGTTTLGANVSTADGAITFSDPVTLTGAVTVDSDSDDDTTDGSITFSSTVNGAQTLTLDAHGGAVTVSGAIGGTTKLTSLTVTGGAVSLKDVKATGAITITGSTRITLAGAYESDDGNIRFTGAVTLAGAVSVDSDKNDDGTDGSITFTSTVNAATAGTQSLTLDADGGAVDLQGAIGFTNKLASLTVDGGQIDVNRVATTGSIDIEGTNIDLNGAQYRSDDGNIRFAGPVDLHINVTVESDTDGDTTDGSITFTSTVNAATAGTQSLRLNADRGAVNLQGAAGGSNKLRGLTITGGSVSLKDVKVTGAITVTGSSGITLAGSYESDGFNITFNSAVTLAGAVTVDSDKDGVGTAGGIAFASTVNGSHALTLDANGGAVTVFANIGGLTSLTSLTVTGGAVSLESVRVTGAITVTGSTGITLDGGYRSRDGNITFSGAVTLDDQVSVDSNTNNDGTAGSISFTSTVNGGHSLTVAAGTSSVTFSGAVGGGGNRLTSLTVNGGQIDLNTVATSGAISVTGTNIDLNAGSYSGQGGNITFTGAVDLNHSSAVTVSSGSGGGNISFSSTVNGGRALTVTAGTGSVTFSGAVGGATALTGFSVTGNSVSLRSVTLTGTGTIAVTGSGGITLNGTYTTANRNIDFNSAVTLAGAVTVNSGSGGGNISFDSTVNGGHSLTVAAGTGSVTFSGAVGGSTRLTSLTVGGGQIDLSTVATTGAISVTGTNIDLNGASYGSNDGSITFTGPVDLHTNVTVDSDQNNNGTDGNITFTSTVNALNSGTQSLTLDADGGDVELRGAVGGTRKLNNLTITGDDIALGAFSLAGTLTLTPGGTITLKGNITVDDTAISFSRPVILAANITIDTDGDNDGIDGSITFSSTVNGRHSLTLDADRGAVTVSGAIGATTKLSGLTVTGGAVSLKDVKATGAIRVTGWTSITLAGAYESDDGNISFIGAVTLAGAVSVDSDKDNDGTDGNINFTSAVNGSHALTLDADGGAVSLQRAVGGSTKLASLTVDGGQIDLNTVATTGAISVTGTNIDLNGATYGSNDGAITFTGPVDLHTNVRIDSDLNNNGTDGNITFTSTVNAVTAGAQSLTLDADGGDVELRGAVGATRKLNNFTITGDDITLGAVTLGGRLTLTPSGTITLKGNITVDDTAISFSRPVVLGANVRIDTDGDNDGTDGSITFSSTVNGGYALTLDADAAVVTMSGAVGGSTRLASLTVDGGQIDLHTVATTGAISIRGTNIDLNAGSYNSQGGNITFTGAVDLNHSSAVTVTSGSGGGNISFSSTVNGGRALTVTAGTGSVTFSGVVGGSTRLTSLTVSGGQIDLNTVATVGAISVTGTNIDLNGATYGSNDGAITFTGPVDLHTNVTVNSDHDNDSADGNITFTSTVNAATAGMQSLTLNAGTGDVELRGAVGATRKLNNLTITGDDIRLGAVTLGGTLTLNSGGTITLKGNITVDDTAISFGRPVVLAANIRINTDGDNDATDGSITFSSTVNGAHALTLDADSAAVVISGAVGGSTRLTSLTIDGGQIDLNTVATTGAISVTGTNIDLNGATYGSNDGAITFTGPVDLHTDVRIDSDLNNHGTDGSITFTSTVTAVTAGAQSLTLDADRGAITVSGAIGGTTKLSSLTVTGGTVSLKDVKATGAIRVLGWTSVTLVGAYESDDGNISFTGAVTLAGAVSVDSDKDDDANDGSISFSSAVNGGHSLTLDAGSGTVTLSGAVGSSTRLASLTVVGGQIDLNTVATTGAISIRGTNIDLNAGSYNSQGGNITFTGAVDLDHSSAVTVTSGSGGGNISFSSTVNGGRALTVTAGTGSVTISGAVGGGTRLTSLTVSGGQIDLNTVATVGAISVTGTNIDLNGATYGSNDGAITFTGPVDLHTNVTVDSDQNNNGTDGNITFTSSVNAVTVGAQSLTLDADGGDVELRGAVGGAIKLNNLTITGDDIRLGAVTLAGTLTLNAGGTITLKGNITVDDTAISFGRPVVLAANVRIDTDGDNDGVDGSITFSSTVNGAHALTLDADTAAVAMSGAVGGSTRLASLTIKGGQIDLNTVATTGAISVTGTNIDLNGATYNSQDGNIRFAGPVDLHTSVTVDSDQDNDGVDGSITFTSTVNAVTAGAQSLTLDADRGAITVSGAIGGTTKLSGLTVTGGAVSLKDVKATGAIRVTGWTSITLAGAYESDDGNISFTGAVTLAGAVSVDSDKDNDAADGSISFSSAVNGARTLTLDADGGTVTLSGAIGGTTRLTSLTVDGGQIDLNTVATTGAISVTGTNIDLNGATYGSNDGAITFTGPVDLHTNVRIDSDLNNNGTDGNITFTSTVNGGRTLTLDADGGAVNLQGAVGGSTRLTSLTVVGGQIDLNTVATVRAISVTGTNIDLNAGSYNSQDGNIRFAGPVDLHTSVTVDSDQDNDGVDGSITFTSTVNAATAGTQSLTLDADGGAVTVSGAIGGTTKLASLTVTGGAVSLRDAKATGAITVTGSTGITLSGVYESDDGNIIFTGAVTLAGAVTVDSDKDNDSTDGSITFTSTVNGARTLTLDADSGAVTLSGAIGGSIRLTSLTVDGGQIDVNTVATTGAIDIEGTNIDLNGTSYASQDGNIRFAGPVDLHANVRVDSNSDNDGTHGSITFTSTVNGARTLTLDADNGAVDLQAAVGGTVKLTSLTVDGGQVDLNTVATTGSIDIEGVNIDLNGATYESDDGNIRFAGPVDLHSDVSVDSDSDNDGTDGSITFTSRVDGAHALTLDADSGAVTVSGLMGDFTKLTSLTVNGGAVSLNGTKATGAITVTGSTLITLSGPYESNDGNIDFNGAVTLAGAVTVDSDKDNDATDGNVTFTSTVNGGRTLTIDADRGTVTLQGAVGATTRLTSLTVDGGQIDVNTVATTGSIDIEGTNIDLNGATYNSQDGNIRFAGPVDLHTSVTVDSDGDGDGTDGSITFTSTVDAVTAGTQSLTLDADRGAVTVSGAIGGTTKLSSLTVTGGAVSLKDVKVTGPITVTGHSSITLDGDYESDDGSIRILGSVILVGAVSVDSDKDNDTTDGSITFSSRVNGTHALTLDADSGSITVGGAMGGTTKLASLTATAALVYLKDVKATGPIMVTGSTGITLDGAYESDDNNIDFDGAVTLSGAVSVDSDKDNDGTDGNITFTSTVNAASAGTQSLTIDADGGDVELRGAVGGTTLLSSLTIVGGQVDLNTVATASAINVRGTNIDLNGATYLSQDGPITFTGPVDLHTSVTVDSDSDNDGADGSITFTSTVNAVNAGTQSLTIDADTGNVALLDAVGGTTRLASLTVDGGQIDLASVATTGAIDIDGTNIDLNGSTYGSNDGPITFTGPVDLHTGVTVDSDQNNDGTDGSITFTSTVNGGHSLTLDADTGSVELRGAVGGFTKLASLTVDGGQIDLASVATTGAIDVDGTNIDLNGSSYGSDDGNVDFRAAVDLHTSVTVDSDNDNDGTAGNITFHSTVDAASAGTQSLTLDAGSGTVTLTAAVGGTTRLASLTVSGGQIDLNTVATTGAISVTGTNIDLNGATYNSQGGPITFTGPVDLHANVTVSSGSGGGNISFGSTVNGGRSLTVTAGTGSVTFSNPVGGSTRLTSLTVSGGQIDLSTVATTGTISVTGTNIDLNGSTYESDDGNIRFAGPVDLHTDVSVDSDKDDDTADGNITFTSTIDAATRGAQSLTLDADTGTITIEGAIGGTTALRDLTTNAGMVELKGGFTLTGDFEVPGAITLGEGAYNSANANYGGPVTLSGNVTMTSSGNAGDGITFGSTITGTYSLVLNAGDGTVTISGEAGTEDSPLASLTVNAGVISLNSITTTGAITLTGTTIDLNGTDYRSNDGDISFNGPIDLNIDVTMDSDANDDGTTGSITFADNVNGAGQSLTIVRAHDVTVKATMTVASFTQLAGTGTTDFGSNSLHAETFVDVSTGNIFGTIFAEDATLRASNLIRVTVEVGSLTIEAKDAHVTGTVDELDGQAAADSIIINNRGPGVYKANGFTILGTGPGTRTYAELSALPFSVTMDAARYSSTPASAVYGSRIPVLRASVTDATVGPYAINAHEMPFPLFTQQPSADCTENELQCVGLDMH